jgi:hypothetical protein
MHGLFSGYYTAQQAKRRTNIRSACSKKPALIVRALDDGNVGEL